MAEKPKLKRLKEMIPRLKGIVSKGNLLTKEVDLLVYSYDAGAIWQHLPDCVVFPETTRQVSEIIKLANCYRIPVTPRGGGTNQSGGSIPILGGIVMCFTKMNRIIEIDEENQTATLEPGVVLQDFNVMLAEKGLYFPPDPQSFFAATMGGILAENAGGPVCLKYGVTKQYVLRMEVVLPDGRVSRFGGLTMNNFFGYDLATLMIGSEGTLGVITQATVRLLRLSEGRETVMAVFDDVVSAGEVVHKIISHGVIASKTEIIDNWVIRKSEEFNPVGFPLDADAIILFETDGKESLAKREAEIIVELCERYGAREARIAKDAAEADRYWAARRAGFAATFSSAPNVLAEDVCVPVKSIPDLLTGIKRISHKYDVEIVVLGHAGDGNMHPDVLTDKSNTEWFERAEKAMGEIIELALNLKGVISGEHGIGLEKKRFIDSSMDPNAIRFSKLIKGLFDPNNIMNPGKIWN